MNTFKQLALFIFFGAPVGATVTSFAAPPLVEILHAPVSEPSAMCNCSDLAENIMATFWHMQIGGTLAGAVLGGVIWFLLHRTGRLTVKKA